MQRFVYDVRDETLYQMNAIEQSAAELLRF